MRPFRFCKPPPNRLLHRVARSKAKRRRQRSLHLLTVLMVFLGLVPQQLLTLPFWTPPVLAAEQAAPQADTPASLPPALAEANAAPPAVAYPLPDGLQDKPEIADARTADSATFDLGNGHYALLEETHPLNYRNAKGSWQRIDPSFQAVEGGWLNIANTLKTSVAQTNSSAKISLNEAGVGWEPVTLQITAANGQTQTLAAPLPMSKAVAGVRSADSHTIRYTQSWDSASLADQWQLNYGAAAYALELKQRFPPQIATPQWLDLTVHLHLKPGTSVQLAGKPVSLPVETSQALAFVTAQGETLLLQPPRLYEAKNVRQQVAGHYLLARTDDPSTVVLRVRFAWSWANAAARQFPLILDPVFQTVTPSNARSALYDSGKNFKGYDDAPPLKLGQFKDETRRLLVSFALPTMPPGTTLTSAHLLVIPVGSADNDTPGPNGVWTANGVAHGELQDALIHAYALTNGDWTSGAAPSFDASVPLNSPHGGNGGGVGPDVAMIYSRGLSGQLAVDWDVTTLAQQWASAAGWNGILIDPNVHNYGVVFTLKNEFCSPDPLNCGGFTVASPAQWQEDELGGTEAISTPDAAFNSTSAGSGGVRLVVFYSGPQLNEGQTLTQLPNPSIDPPFYHAGHEYRIGPLPGDHWQAAVARGIGPTTLNNPPDYDHPNVHALQGSLPLELREASSTIHILGNTATNDGVGYFVFNGAASPGAQSSLRVQTPGGNPLGYDVRLISQEPTTLAAQLYTPAFISSYNFDSSTPLTLWKVTVPTASNSRVDIRVNGVPFYDPRGNFYALAQNFQAQLFRGSDGAFHSPEKPYLALNNFTFNGTTRLSSPIFSASSGEYALALSYNGPAEDLIPPPKPPAAAAANQPSQATGGNATTDLTHLSFSLDVRVTSCPKQDADGDATFPTASGTCQKVKCPTSLTFPIGTPNYRQSGAFGVWAAGGWSSPANPATTNEASGAPMIGNPVAGSFPSVAIVGGTVTVNGVAATVNTDSSGAPPTVMLVSCGDPANAINSLGGYFSVYNGTMAGDAYDPGNDDPRSIGLHPSAVGGTVADDVWRPQDRVDVTPTYLEVNPYDAVILRQVQLRRVAGKGAEASTVNFNNVNWSIGVNGWPSLDFGRLGGISFGGGSPPSVASLLLDLGNRFNIDAEPPRDPETARHFVALRANFATITQPTALGGASKPVQALILSRGSDPATGLTCESVSKALTSCVDLRAPDDTPTHPDRTWQMPDVHVAGPAGLVAVSTGGELQVYSKDFPADLKQGAPATLTNVAFTPQLAATFRNSAPLAPNATHDFNGNFSYDTFGAKVSITHAKCDPGDATEVDVIEGVTVMALPNVGDSSDASSSIKSSFKLCQTSLRSVHMEFHSPIGIPVGDSGLFMTGLAGTVDIYPSHTTIQFGIDLQAAPGGDGGLVKVHGDVTIDTRGLFEFQGQGSVLKGAVGITGALWVGWSPLDIGFKVTVGFPLRDPWVTGFMRAHMWQGQGFNHRYKWLPDNGETHIAAEIGAQVLIEKGAAFSWWFIDIPPDDIRFGIDVAFGQFCTNDGCTTYEWGVKGKFTVVGYDVGLYYTFGHDLGHPEVNPGNLSFILGNDDHKLIDEVNGGTDVPLRSAQLNSPDTPVEITKAPEAVNGETRIPLTVSPQAQQLLFGLGWQAGAPQLTLIQPDGLEITPANAALFNAQFSNSQQSTLIGVKNPKPGQWQAHITNLSQNGVEHYQFTYFANHGGPVNPGDNLFLTPAKPDEVSMGSYHITWRVPANTTDKAHISLYATRTTGPIVGNLDVAMPIVQNLPLKAGAYDWNTTALVFGSYQVSAVVDDGINDAPTTTQSDNTCDPNFNPLPTHRAFDSQRFASSEIFTATGTVQADTVDQPPTPTNLTLTPQDGALLARWDPSPDGQVVAYQVTTCALFCGNPQTVVATSHPALRINALHNGVAYQVNVVAQNVIGSTSTTPAVANGTPDAKAEPLPSAPLTPTLTSATGATANLTWQPAPGETPASYRVTYTQIGSISDTHQATTNVTSITLTGLTVGATYKVAVNAANSGGWYGPNSGTLVFVATSGVDADGDGLPDDWAAKYGVHGANADADGDGLTNLQEFQAGTDPTRQNSDGDPFSDKEEVDAKTDPLDSLSYSTLLTQPRLALSQDQVVFHTKLQTPSDPALNATIQWSNIGGGKLTLNAASSANWLTAQVNENQLIASVNKDLLTPGYQTGVIQLTPAAGSDPLIGAPGCVRVQMWASPPDVAPPFSGRIWLPLIHR